VSCDFPGLARGIRDREQPQVAHVHFNGAAGNVTAGKYNDGSPENRPALASRLAAGMKAAWESTKKSPLEAKDVRWESVPVALPPAKWLDRDKLQNTVTDKTGNTFARLVAAGHLAWLERCQSGHQIDVTCLRLGEIAVVHMPGELFIEYQLAAQKLRPDAPTVMAAYGDYGMGYIGLEESYSQGGYETGPASLVAPEVEGVLMGALRTLLK
jgi:hypothetical protein